MRRATEVAKPAGNPPAGFFASWERRARTLRGRSAKCPNCGVTKLRHTARADGTRCRRPTSDRSSRVKKPQTFFPPPPPRSIDPRTRFVGCNPPNACRSRFAGRFFADRGTDCEFSDFSQDARALFEQFRHMRCNKRGAKCFERNRVAKSREQLSSTFRKTRNLRHETR